MRKLILFLTVSLFATCSFAVKPIDPANPLKSLGAVFQSPNTLAPKFDPKDITMGYAGQDLSDKNFIA